MLLIEDSVSSRLLVTEYLGQRGLTIVCARGLAEAREILPILRPAVTILDIELEDGDGFELIEEIKDFRSRCIVVSVRSEASDRKRALRLSADDYLCKPFDIEELYLRVVNLASNPYSPGRPVRDATVRLGSIHINLATRAMLDKNGMPLVLLTQTEFLMLETLCKNSNFVVSKEALSQASLGHRYLPSSRSLEVLVSRLRHKLTLLDPCIILKSVRGEGYVLYLEPETGS